MFLSKPQALKRRDGGEQTCWQTPNPEEEMVVGKPQTLKGDVGRKEMLANPKNCKRKF